MKHLLGVLLPLALLVLACMAAVELLDDRELFVSPPETVAEGFTREVMTKRYPRARDYLLEPDAVTDEQLAALQSRLAEGENVEAETTSQDAEQASVDVTVKETTLTMPMVWEEGWKVARVP